MANIMGVMKAFTVYENSPYSLGGLYLQEIDFSEETAENIAALCLFIQHRPKLAVISFDHSRLSTASFLLLRPLFAELAKHPGLRKLSFAATDLGNASQETLGLVADVVKSNRVLEGLNLACSFTAEHKQDVSIVLEAIANSKVQELNFSGNDIGDPTHGCVPKPAFLHMLATSSLKSFAMQTGALHHATPDYIEAMGEALVANQHITKVQVSSLLEWMENDSAYEKSFDAAINFLTRLVQCQHIRSLRLHGHELYRFGTAGVKGLLVEILETGTLQSLNLDCTGLKTLCEEETSCSIIDVIEDFIKKCQLEELSIAQNGFSFADMQRFAMAKKSNPRIKKFVYNGNLTAQENEHIEKLLTAEVSSVSLSTISYSTFPEHKSLYASPQTKNVAQQSKSLTCDETEKFLCSPRKASASIIEKHTSSAMDCSA